MDPFTQKLLERSKARKEYLDAKFAKIPQPAPRKRRSPLKDENNSAVRAELPEKVLQDDGDSPEKRHCVEQEKSECKVGQTKHLKENVLRSTITPGTKHSLKALAQLHSDDYDNGADVGLTKPLQRPREKSDAPDSLVTPIPKGRTNRFAALAENINKWEDDLRLSQSLAKSSKTSSSPLRPKSRIASTSPTAVTPKLKLDVQPSPPDDKSPTLTVGRSSSITSETSSASSHSSKRRSSSFSSPANKRSSQMGSPCTAEPQPTRSSKKVVWDQAIVATLQAQGFVQSPSKSKLEYNFRKPASRGSIKGSPRRMSEALDKSDDEEDDHGISSPPRNTNRSPARTSVKELAQKFTGPPIKPAQHPQKDPAELPLAARVALFEKEAENAANAKSNPVSSGPKKPKRASIDRRNFPVAMSSSVVPASPLKKQARITSPNKPQVGSPVSPSSAAGSPVSPSKVGKHAFQLHRQLFEHGTDWKENEISVKIKEDRQKDMEVVLNRWSQKNKAAAIVATSSVHGEVRDSKGTSQPSSLAKPLVTVSKEQVAKTIPPPPPLPGQTGAPPVVISEVQRYVEDSFSEEESHVASEISESEGSSILSSNFDADEQFRMPIDEGPLDAGSVESSSSEESTGESFNETELDSSILQAAFKKVSPMKKIESLPAPAPERAVTQTYKSPSPKQTDKVTHLQNQDPSESDVATPLLHTVSFYRRQKDTLRLTPVRTVVHRQEVCSPPTPPETTNDAECSPCTEDRQRTIQEKIKDLQEEINAQQVIMGQTSQALNLCRSTSEFHGSAEQIEGERLLLIATQKRIAYLNEIQRLKADAAKGKEGSSFLPSSKGSLSISEICLPLKKEYLVETSNGTKGEFVSFFLCLVKHRAQIIATQMVSTHDCISAGAFKLPNLINIRDLNRDFNVVVEVYGLQTKRENIVKEQRSMANKKEKSRLALTPKKRQSKRDLRMNSPAVQSPGGPSAVCTSSFAVIGYAAINIKTLQRKSWVLEKCPFTSPLEGNIFLKVQCHTDFNTQESGFLTMFEDVGGFGAWHRRWFVLSSRYISYWKYPDDVKQRDPIGKIDLCKCITSKVGLVSRDICARPHTLMLLTVKPLSHDNVDTLVSQSYSSYTAIKVLLSADTKEERVAWCQHLNRAIDNVRAWDPEALRPMPSDPAAPK